jgi:hypothetical protein
MKTSISGTKRMRTRGSAVLVVLALLACIGLMLYANSKTIYHLDQEIKLLDTKQQLKYGKPQNR